MEMKYAHGMNLTRITEFEKDLHASIINSQESKSPDKQRIVDPINIITEHDEL